MTISVKDCEKVWDEFLNHWPLESLHQLSLNEYSHAGNQDTFTYWLETITEKLGSIWGGSSFKFGVYSRRDQSEKIDGAGKSYNEDYGWYSKYGKSPEEAFEKVRAEIIAVAKAARIGDLATIDSVGLGEAIKWKIAFLYQNRNKPSVLPIYKSAYLRLAINSTQKKVSLLQELVIKNLNGKNIFDYYDEIWESLQEKLRTELSPQDAKTFFESSDHFELVKPPTKKIAGFISKSNGQQLALELGNKRTTLYLNDGNWLNSVRSDVKDVIQYPPNKSRNSNLEANAPQLALSNPIVKLVVPTMDNLIAVCEAYENNIPSNLTTPSQSFTVKAIAMQPLNQILYGPPGTGKTFATIDETLRIIDPHFLNANQHDRKALKARFDTLAAAGHVRFVTFHQSFCYEDFVEGLRAENDENGQLHYEVVEGIFKNICDAAAAKITQQTEAPIDISGRKVWKMSLGNSLGVDSYIYDECIENGYALLGYGELTDFSGCKNRDEIYSHYGLHPLY